VQYILVTFSTVGYNQSLSSCVTLPSCFNLEFSDELLLILGSGVGLEDLISSFVVKHLLDLLLIILCVHNHCSLPLVGRNNGYIFNLGQVSQGLSFPLGQVGLRRFGRVKQSC